MHNSSVELYWIVHGLGEPVSDVLSPGLSRTYRWKTTSGWINGFIGVAIFAGSLPATRVAVAAFEPTFLTCARATIAAMLGALVFDRATAASTETG
jgi:hypothetical protein